MRNLDSDISRLENLSQNFYADYQPFNFVDGEGVRNSLYVSGCLFNCDGCYNKAAWDFSYGKLFTKEVEQRIINDTYPSYVQGLTLLGGEPFLNTSYVVPFVKHFRKIFGNTKDIWCFTGYTWEELQKEKADKKELLSLIDILVDGRFEISQKKLNLQFRGSQNQRIIDVQKSLRLNQVIIWEKLM